MRGHRTNERRRRAVAVRILVVGLLLCAMPVAAWARAPVDLDDARRDRDAAADRREQLQVELDELLSQIEALKVAQEQQSARIDHLQSQVRRQQDLQRAARDELADRYKEAYKNGASSDALVLLFGGDDPADVTERAHLLNLLARDSERRRETAEGASVRTAALADQLDEATAQLAEQQAELDDAQAQAREKVAAAQADVDDAERRITAEEERRAEERRRREAAAAAAAAAEEEARREAEAEAQAAAQAQPGDPEPDSGGGSGGGDTGGGDTAGGDTARGDTAGGGGGSATVSGGIACPVGEPHNFSDTYGAPRSGGRSHKGVDILSPIGTAIYAYEDGTVTRTNSSSLGGISLYLQGDSGNLYYYTHLSGYVSGIGPGDRVAAGQHIAYNGDSGNAAGIPHLHWEVMPGGGGNVNPYPYALEACG